MLCLGRKKGETVNLILPSGETIVVGVAEIRKGASVRLTFEAPADVKIVRPDAKKKQERDCLGNGAAVRIPEGKERAHEMNGSRT